MHSQSLHIKGDTIMSNNNSATLNATYERLINALHDAEVEHKVASKKLDSIKNEIKNFSKATGITNFESELGKIAVYQTGGGMSLDADKVRALLSKPKYESCLVERSTATAVRLTLKK
jgi:pyruvate/oxaloacetate carboxyltransferase